VLGFLACALHPELLAAPYVPARDDEILERSSAASSAGARELRAYQARLRADPRNLDLALQAARTYIARARESADPRFMGYAQASLAPWWNANPAPVPVLVMRATILQAQHDFAPALADLAKALERDPRNVQAWLTRSTIELVIGEPRAARESCSRLAPLAPPLIAKTCIAAAESMLGRAEAAHTMLTEALESPRKLPDGIEAWSRGVLAEIAERLGKDAQAEHFYREALAMTPGDTYTRAGFADFLLDRGRAHEALELVHSGAASDVLLLRAVLAARAVRDVRGDTWEVQLAERFHASRQRGDKTHLREEARFELHVRRNTDRALALAVENWRTQKDLADARMLMEAALAAGRPAAAKPALNHIAQYGIESVSLSRLRSQLQKAG
jgi:Tfp pilus assembly protein PilF